MCFAEFVPGLGKQGKSQDWEWIVKLDKARTLGVFSVPCRAEAVAVLVEVRRRTAVSRLPANSPQSPKRGIAFTSDPRENSGPIRGRPCTC